MFNCFHKIFCFVRSAYKTLHVARRRFMPLAFHALKRVTCFALVLFCKLARLIIDLFVNCLHKKQHQLCCLVDEHSWCFISEIGAICAVIYGVLAFTPPIKLQRKVLHFLELGTKKQEQRWVCFGERSILSDELWVISYELISFCFLHFPIRSFVWSTFNCIEFNVIKIRVIYFLQNHQHAKYHQMTLNPPLKPLFVLVLKLSYCIH